MKICHTISSIDKNSGGTSTYLQLLANNLAKQTCVTIATLQTEFPLQLAKNVDIYLANPSFPQIQSYSKDLKKYLHQMNADIFHGNGMWQYPVYAMAKTAKYRNKPYIISPHGMLEPWALNIGKWKKKLALALYQRNDIAKAACIHATAQMEAENIRNLGFNNPIAVIPNGIDISEFPIKPEIANKENNTILFLSRIHPKKGIENLIEAWSRIEKMLRKNWQIEIAGNGEENYIASLQKLIEAKGLQNDIKIIGPQFGDAKLHTYHKADLFVLPTYSENFGIVVAEALACGVPVITTKGTPWEEINTCNAGWWIDIGVQSLAATLKVALQTTEEQRMQMGKNGRKLVEEKYSIEAVASQMIQLYQWILYEGEKPEFIYEQS